MTQPQAESAQGGVQARESERTTGRNGDRAPIAESRSFGGPGRELTIGEGGRGLFDPLLSAHFEMNRWFDDLWRQMTGMGAPSLRTARPFAGYGASAAFGLPACDLKETDKAYRLSVELPGLARDDIDLQVRGDALQISGQKAEEKDDAGATYRFSERRFGRFERAFPIPDDVDRDKIAAQFADGLLKIELPKSPEATPKSQRIAIR